MKKLGETIGKFVVKHRILIVIASILLCIPSLFGYINTDINYDILVYLPEDIDTMKGQDILAEDFDMGSFAMCVVENMSSKDILDLEEKFKGEFNNLFYDENYINSSYYKNNIESYKFKYNYNNRNIEKCLYVSIDVNSRIIQEIYLI